MITEAIMTGLFGVADLLLGLLPEIEWTVNTTAWQYVGDIMSMIAYLLPMDYIVALAMLLISIALFRIFVSMIHNIKSFIPGLG